MLNAGGGAQQGRHRAWWSGSKELGLYTQSDREPLRDFAVN